MSKNQDNYEMAVRIFEALSSVDEELLERSSKSRKVIPFRRATKIMAACACFALVAVLTWYGSLLLMPKGSDKSAGTETQMSAADEGAYYYKEGDAVEDAVVTEAEMELVENDTDMPSELITENNANQEELQVGDSAPLAPEAEEFSMAEIREEETLGAYVPDRFPEGYVFESGSRETDGSLFARWSKGMDDIVISVMWYESDAETDGRIVDVTKPETYDVHLYDIPYAETVPEEYRQIFDNPIFPEKDFSAEMVSARIKEVADEGDTGTPRGRFSVLYESGVIVSFNGDCDAERVWQMFTSIGQ